MLVAVHRQFYKLEMDERNLNPTRFLRHFWNHKNLHRGRSLIVLSFFDKLAGMFSTSQSPGYQEDMDSDEQSKPSFGMQGDYLGSTYRHEGKNLIESIHLSHACRLLSRFDRSMPRG